MQSWFVANPEPSLFLRQSMALQRTLTIILSVKSDVIQAVHVSNSNFSKKQLWDLDVFLFHCQI